MPSGILEILITISLITPAFLIGSLLESFNKSDTLKLMKSCAESSKYFLSSSLECDFAKLSGSSPSGN